MATNGHVAALLGALEEGRLSVEAALRGLAELPGFDAVATSLLETAATRDRRRQTLREPSLPLAARSACLDAFRRALPRECGARSSHWGKAYRGGERGEGAALVVLVDRKLAARELPAAQLIPRSFRYSHENTEYSIEVDVQICEDGDKHAGECRRGRGAVDILGGSSGTISAVLEDAAGVATLVCSGHVAKAVDAVAEIRDFSGDLVHTGRVARVVDDDLLDLAAIPVPNDRIGTCCHAPPGATRELGDGDIDLFVKVERARDGTEAKAFVEAVHMETTFGGKPMRGLIRLDRSASRSGDSGAPVVDSGGRLVGFVIGLGAVNGHTYVLPAGRVIDALLQNS